MYLLIIPGTPPGVVNKITPTIEAGVKNEDWIIIRENFMLNPDLTWSEIEPIKIVEDPLPVS